MLLLERTRFSDQVEWNGSGVPARVRSNRHTVGEQLNNDPVFIGDQTIETFIPSRYASGAMIPEQLRESAYREVSSEMASLTGGSTREEVYGVYRSESGSIIDEPITRVYSVISADNLLNDNDRDRLFKAARDCARQLSQECVLVKWGSAVYLVTDSHAEGSPRGVPFSNLERDAERIASLAWSRTSGVDDIGILLSLDCWVPPDQHTNKGSIPAGLRCLLVRSVSARKLPRHAYAWLPEGPVQGRLVSSLGEGDLVFRPAVEGVEISLVHQGVLLGPRLLPLATKKQGHVPRHALEFSLALLGARGAKPLAEFIRQDELTSGFYLSFRHLRERTAMAMEGAGIDSREAIRQAQLLLGRLMFLRFLEERGWLDDQGDFLSRSFLRRRRVHGEPVNFHAKVLEPLFFDLLDRSHEQRRHDRQGVPYLNGGLFQPTLPRGLEIPDSLFDPGSSDSILGVFYHYAFTLDEQAGDPERVSVNPSMLGRVLEGLTAAEERKSGGVHYTPIAIGKTLAFESILLRVSALTRLPDERLRRFASGSHEELTSPEAKSVQESLHQLRIVDPAVGSGSLLLAALQVLMDWTVVCNARQGLQVVPGASFWSEEARRFVRESLFGVDIDPTAVEIARLRLWLAVAVADTKPRPLPDLALNIRTGDSVRPDPLDAELRAAQDPQGLLEFSERDQLLNKLREHWEKYTKTDGTSPALIRRAALEVRAIQQRLRELLSESHGNGPDPHASPVSWRLCFPDVFERDVRGFDVVLANPPYVRIQQIPPEQRDELKRCYESMARGNSDIFFAFVEKGLEIAGESGYLAFILPDFSRSKAAAWLRHHLGSRGAVDRWVAFRDIQVFPSATNYPALLFARGGNAPVRTAGGRRVRKTFECCFVTQGDWQRIGVRTDWLTGLETNRVEYSGEKPWLTITRKEKRLLSHIEHSSCPLGDLCDIHVGVQTSADSVFLFDSAEQDGKMTTVFSDALGRKVTVESAALMNCAKGSRDIRAHWHDERVRLLWPYDGSGKLRSEDWMRSHWPRTWAYLTLNRKRLRAREGGAFAADGWWRFGRAQGIRAASQPKLVVPSAMLGARAVLDLTGGLAFTASGKGGGGAWGLVPGKEPTTSLYWLAAVLNSTLFWRWLLFMGDTKQGGWRGVDQATLESFPVPRAGSSAVRKARALVESVRVSGDDSARRTALEQLEELVESVVRG